MALLGVVISLQLLGLRFPLSAQIRATPPVQISIAAEPTTVKQGEDIKLHVTLVNVSANPIDIAISRPECDNAVNVTDATGVRLARLDGQPLKSPQGATARVPCSDVFSRKRNTIKPGEKIEGLVRLGKIFDLSKPGTYSVVVVRDIDLDHASPEPTLARATSNTVTISVIP